MNWVKQEAPNLNVILEQRGMTLRDYFAAKALQGICASGPTHEWSNSRLAAEAYDLADAMMEARNAAQ
jgi:hypothetical protein